MTKASDWKAYLTENLFFCPLTNDYQDRIFNSDICDQEYEQNRTRVICEAYSYLRDVRATADLCGVNQKAVYIALREAPHD